MLVIPDGSVASQTKHKPTLLCHLVHCSKAFFRLQSYVTSHDIESTSALFYHEFPGSLPHFVIA